MLPGVSRTNYRRCSVDVAREVDWQHHRFQVPAAAAVAAAVVATAEAEFVVDIGLVRLVEAALVVALAAAVAAAAAGFA